MFLGQYVSGKFSNFTLLLLLCNAMVINSAQNKNFACTGQMIITALIQAVKLPSTVVTRLPFLICPICFSEVLPGLNV